MRRSFLLTLTLLASWSSATSYDQQILKQFADQQQQLHQQLMQFCDQQGTAPISAWQATAIAWFEVEALQVPAAEFVQTKFAYVFWPDPKDRLRNQIGAALSQPVDQTSWAELPAAVTSLSALEYLLTQDGTTQHCNWLLAISDSQVAQSQQLFNLQRYYSFDTPEQINALHGSAMVLHSHLKEVLSRPGKTMWVLAPAWRSETGPSIANALVQQSIALLSLFQDQQTDVTAWQQRLRSLPTLAIESTRADIELVNETTEALAKFVENTLAPAVNVYMGFNNFDGD